MLVVAIVAAGALLQLSRDKRVLKLIFNCSQLAVTYGARDRSLSSSGGVSLFELKDSSVAEVTIVVGLPMTVAYLVVFLLNGLLVSQVVALSTNSKPGRSGRRAAHRRSDLDFLALPLVFAFAWIYAKFGPMIASVFGCRFWDFVS